MKEISIKAYAKINLSLDILGKLDNGYHQVKMVMHMVELHDDVKVKWVPGEGDFIIKLSSGKPYIPNDERNIAYKAALLMKEKCSGNEPKSREEEGTGAGNEPLKGTLYIDVEKNIPVAAGLAGGSGNGGAVVLALNHIWNMNLSLEELCEIGGSLGADVSFSIMGLAKMNESLGFAHNKFAATCAVAEGTGTELTPLPPFKTEVILSKPPHSVSTKEVYGGIKLGEIEKRPDIKEQVCGIYEKNPQKVRKNMVNVLENYTLNRYDRVMYTKNKMQKLCKKGTVLMSGSGPTVFAITEDKTEIDNMYTQLRKVNEETYSTRTIG